MKEVVVVKLMIMGEVREWGVMGEMVLGKYGWLILNRYFRLWAYVSSYVLLRKYMCQKQIDTINSSN